MSLNEEKTYSEAILQSCYHTILLYLLPHCYPVILVSFYLIIEIDMFFYIYRMIYSVNTLLFLT